MSSDFDEIWYAMDPPKSARKLKLSDFDEIWYPGVFEDADFKNRIHFYVESFFQGIQLILGLLSFSLKFVKIEGFDRFYPKLTHLYSWVSLFVLSIGLCVDYVSYSSSPPVLRPVPWSPMFSELESSQSVTVSPRCPLMQMTHV